MAEAAKKVKKTSLFSRLIKFLKEVKAELKKVMWPNRKQVINNTAVVIVSIAIVGVVIWVLDSIFGQAVQLLIK